MPIHVSAELSHVCPLEDITAHAAALELGGFYRVWVPDTVVSPWEAWLAASLIMQTTSRIRLGLGVTNPYTRHPVVMAQMAATITRADFFLHPLTTLAALRDRVAVLEAAGFDEVIVAYAERADLEATARLLD